MNPREPMPSTLWYLEGAVDESGQIFRIPIDPLPFRIGREARLDLSLPSQVVSSRHAELSREGDQLVVRDLGSTNGTFVNKVPVDGQMILREGDILQLATIAFRVRSADQDSIDALSTSTARIDTRLTARITATLQRFRRLLDEEAVTQLFQPIVSLQGGNLLGYEVLGRGNLEGLTTDVRELFELAHVIGAELDLSLLLRRRSVATCGSLAGDFRYFLNTHPAELTDDTLLRSLRQAREEYANLPLAVEVHEASVTDLDSIRRLQQGLNDLDMSLVYDDFGAGQARLLELAEVPPVYLKFDRSLIRGIHNAPQARMRLLEGLVKVAHELDIEIVAEGLEDEAEAAVCRDLGFAWGQGFLFARPRPAEMRSGRPVPPALEKKS